MAGLHERLTAQSEREAWHEGMERPRRQRTIVLLVLGTLATVFWVNAPLLTFPYVQDDWLMFGKLRGRPLGQVLAEAFSPHVFFYRPLVRVYMALMYHFFGVSAFVSHVMLTACLAANAVMVGLIAREFTKSWELAIFVAMTYAAATTIHMDPLMMQICGAENFGAGLCGFASLWLFLRGRLKLSATLYGVALLFKESAVVLPGLFAAFSWLVEEKGGLGQRTKVTLRRIWPHTAVLVAYAALRWSGGFAMDSSPQGPYYMSFWGRHLVQNSAAYLRWAMEAVLPNVPRAGAVLFGLGVFGTALFLRLRCAGRLPSLQVATELLKEPVVLTVWFVLALLPVLPLPNHTYRYYAGLALPALIIAWWQAMFLIFRRLLGDGLRSNVALGAVLVTVLVASGAALRERVASQIDWDGSNLPLKRAGVVAWVQPLVSSSAAQLSGDMTLLFDGLEVWSFGKEQGPRLWSSNPTLQVFSTAHLKAGDGGTLAIVNAPTNHAEVYTGARNRIELDPTRTFVVHKQDGGVRMDPIRVFLERQAKRAFRSIR